MRLTESDADCKGDDELLQLSIISFIPPFSFSLTQCCRWTGVDWMQRLFPERSSLGWQGKAIMEEDEQMWLRQCSHQCIPASLAKLRQMHQLLSDAVSH